LERYRLFPRSRHLCLVEINWLPDMSSDRSLHRAHIHKVCLLWLERQSREACSKSRRSGGGIAKVYHARGIHQVSRRDQNDPHSRLGSFPCRPMSDLRCRVIFGSRGDDIAPRGARQAFRASPDLVASEDRYDMRRDLFWSPYPLMDMWSVVCRLNQTLSTSRL
jgi:hypothetical protein